MRTIIKVSQKSKTAGSSANRYISERERDPEREGTGSRAVFTPDSDSFKARAADRYLAGGGAKPRPSKHDLHHIIFAFNRHDARALERLGRVPKAELPPSGKAQNEPGDQIGTDPKTERSQKGPDRDAPYRIAVRGAMELIRKELNAASLRWTATVHRHTSNPHVHLLLHKDYEDATTGEAKRLPHRLPLDWLNGRDEEDKPKGGLLDRCLSEALDPLVPPRPNAARSSSHHDAEPSDGRSSKGDDTRPRPQIIIDPIWDSPALLAAWAPSKSSASKAQAPARATAARPGDDSPLISPASTTNLAVNRPHINRPRRSPTGARPRLHIPPTAGRPRKQYRIRNNETPKKFRFRKHLNHHWSIPRSGTRGGPDPLTPRPKCGCAVTSTRSSPPPSQINSVHAPRMRGRSRAGRGSRTKAARPRAPGKFLPARAPCERRLH